MRRAVITLIVFVVAVAALSGGMASAAPVSEDIHGLSYRDGSTIRIGVLPGYGNSIAYQNIDWYITANGQVDIYLDSELVDTLTVSGLYVYRAMYESGRHYNVVFVIGDSSYSFSLDVRHTINIQDFDREAATEVRMFSEGIVILISLVSGLAVGIPIWYSYRRRRELNKRRVINR